MRRQRVLEGSAPTSHLHSPPPPEIRLQAISGGSAGDSPGAIEVGNPRGTNALRRTLTRNMLTQPWDFPRIPLLLPSSDNAIRGSFGGDLHGRRLLPGNHLPGIRRGFAGDLPVQVVGADARPGSKDPSSGNAVTIGPRPRLCAQPSTAGGRLPPTGHLVLCRSASAAAASVDQRRILSRIFIMGRSIQYPFD